MQRSSNWMVLRKKAAKGAHQHKFMSAETRKMQPSQLSNNYIVRTFSAVFVSHCLLGLYTITLHTVLRWLSKRSLHSLAGYKVLWIITIIAKSLFDTFGKYIYNKYTFRLGMIAVWLTLTKVNRKNVGMTTRNLCKIIIINVTSAQVHSNSSEQHTFMIEFSLQHTQANVFSNKCVPFPYLLCSKFNFFFCHFLFAKILSWRRRFKTAK